MKDRIKTETTDAAQGKPSFGKRLWKRVKGFLLAATNPRFLLCFGLAWIITNGWSYALFALGVMLDIGWMTAVAGGYLAFLWFPFSPEKVVTVAISIFLLRLFFPNDEKTLARLKALTSTAKKKAKRAKEKRRAERREREERKTGE